MSQAPSRAPESDGDTPEAVEPEAGDPETGERDDSITAAPAFIVFVLGQIVALGVYMYISRPMWFFLDEWDFLAHRTGGNLGDLFRAHNEHWVTLPVLVYRALWWVFGLRTYRPYQLVIVLLHLGAALLVRTVMRRVGVRPWTATIAASILVFFGSGYQNIVLPFQITLVGSLVLGLVDLLLASHDGPVDRRDLFGLAAGCGALMCSGVGVAMVIAVGVAVLIARGWRVALLHTVPLAAVYLVWFEAIGHKGYTSYHPGVMDVARFVRQMFTTTFSTIGHFSGVGLALAMLLVVGLIVAWQSTNAPERRRRFALPLALIVGAFALLCITGFGRAGHSTFQEKSRYLHLVTAMLLPALAVAADAVMQRWRLLAPIVVVGLLVGIPGNINVIVDYMHKPIVVNQRAYRNMMLSLPRVPAAQHVPRSAVPEVQLAHFVTIGWLLDGAASGRIPKPAHISAADAAMDTLRLTLERTPSQYALGNLCVGIRTSPVFHLTKGQAITVRALSGSVRITPATVNPGDTYPLYVVTVVGPTLVARAPVSFRLSNVGARHGQVCGKPAIILPVRHEIAAG